MAGAALIVLADRMDPSWPPVLTGLAVLLGLAAVVVVIVLFRSFRGAARAARLRPRGFRE